MSRRIRTNAAQLAEAFRKDADATIRILDQVLERGAIEIARKARFTCAKARTTLTNSIAQARLAVGSYEVVAQARYAAYVEDGSGPGGWVPLASMLDWMQAHKIDPRTPGMDRQTLARLIQRSIHAKGTPAQPFMGPAADAEFPAIEMRLVERLQRLIDRQSSPS